MCKDACLVGGRATLDGGGAQLHHLQATHRLSLTLGPKENATGYQNSSLTELRAPASLDLFNFSDYSYSDQN